MSNMIFWKKKNFYLCFPISKCLPTITQQSPSPFHEQEQTHSSSSSSSSSSLMIMKNFNSIYDFTSSDSTFFSASSDDGDSESPPPDLAALYASQRFFFSSPGSSNSIFESTPDAKLPVSDQAAMVDVAGGVKVPKFSINPYIDFRRSMQEMVEARDPLEDRRTDLEYLHELLLCFLALNPKETHKFIISAFTDLVISLLSSPENGHRHRKYNLRRRHI
ncbi:hypothetical protein UlMin_009268 [Ulmus minor]